MTLLGPSRPDRTTRLLSRKKNRSLVHRVQHLAGIVAGLDVLRSLAAVPIAICALTSAYLTHQRTRFALMPFAMATDADDTPSWQRAATVCALNSVL